MYHQRSASDRFKSRNATEIPQNPISSSTLNHRQSKPNPTCRSRSTGRTCKNLINRFFVSFGSNLLLRPHRFPDQINFPQNFLRSIFTHLRYHAPYGNLEFRRVYQMEPNLMEVLPTVTSTNLLLSHRTDPIHRHIPLAREGFPIILLQCTGAQELQLTWTRTNRQQCQLAFDLLRRLCRLHPRGRMCISTYYTGDFRQIGTLLRTNEQDEDLHR